MKFSRYYKIFCFLILFAMVTCVSAFAEREVVISVDQTAEAADGEEETSTTTAPAPTSAPGNVSLDFKDADINNVLRILSLKSKMNIIAGPEVKGTVTIRLEDVPWEKALDVVLRTYGYVYERDGNIVRVTTKENLTTEDLVTETFILNYTTSKEAEEAIKDVLSERGRIKSVPRVNMLIVTDIPTNLYKISEVIKNLDKSTPQAFIDSKIIKTALQQGENLGINWNPTGQLTGSKRPATFPFQAFNKDSTSDPFQQILGGFFPNQTAAIAPNPFNPSAFPTQAVATATTDQFTYGTLDFSSFSAVLSFLKTRSNTKIISNPRITVLNNQTAKVKVGTDIPLPTLERNETTGSFEVSGYSFRETGVVLSVTPHINSADEILVDLKPEVSAKGDDITFSTGTTGAAFGKFPSFTVETAETQVLIRNGQTIAVGGLMTDTSGVSSTKVPILGDIPIIGKAFKSKTQTKDTTNQKAETLFFVTVTIVDTVGDPTKTQTVNQALIGQKAATSSQAASGQATTVKQV